VSPPFLYYPIGLQAINPHVMMTLFLGATRCNLPLIPEIDFFCGSFKLANMGFVEFQRCFVTSTLLHTVASSILSRQCGD
jgi:hypothetical protein